MSAGQRVGRRRYNEDDGTRYEDAARGTSDRIARCIWGSRSCRDRSDGVMPVRNRVAELPAHPTRSMFGSPVLTPTSRMNAKRWEFLWVSGHPQFTKHLHSLRRDPPPQFFFAMPSIADDISLEYVHSLSLSLYSLTRPSFVCPRKHRPPPGSSNFGQPCQNRSQNAVNVRSSQSHTCRA